MTAGHATVLILGAGINGCALARELVLNGINVWLVDSADIASGATSGSSHLIHGGLRYLEYGDFELVKESLAERTRLLRLAPQFVRPLKLWIPSSDRAGGMIGAAGRFWGWKWWPTPQPKAGRGAWLVRAGLTFYDLFARDPNLPRHRTQRVTAPGTPAVDRHKYRWISSYYDAQVVFPERLAMAIVEDAHRLAETHGVEFRVFTYHGAALDGRRVEISPLLPIDAGRASQSIEPNAIVNATGAWVDETLQRLHVPSPPLMGGTKGSHLFTFNTRLRELLGEDGIYAEAPDGRPIFITPLGDTVLIGTTDERFEGPPEKAVATAKEIAYLLDAVNQILPSVRLTTADIDFHYSAVRPLPHASTASTAAISRRHAIVKQEGTAVPLISLVGGKLTTMRSLAESAAAVVLQELNQPVTENSRDWPVTGALDCPTDRKGLTAAHERLAQACGISPASAAAVWRLYGTWAETVLSAAGMLPGTPRARTLLDATELPMQVAQYAIAREHAETLADLVERRLMLLYHQRLSRACLQQLAALLVAAGRLAADQVDAAVSEEVARLQRRYGKRVE